MRHAGLALSLTAGVLLPLASCGDGNQEQAASHLCDALGRELAIAVDPTEHTPKPATLSAFKPGNCDTTEQRRFAADLAGVEANSAVVFSGRVDVVPGFSPEGLVKVRAGAEANRANHLAAVPKLGPDAFIVTRKDLLGGANDEALAADPMPTGRPVNDDPTTALPLPVTVHWRRGDILFTVAASRSRASLAETKRVTLRLAELLNRHPVDDPAT